ncbi:unnamed protein product [Owenia fusiformis]|uniref:Uncharacterized protein n=1 Tax=Owenia fusiformis TaxID=6347 RepID=A0A8J1UBH2_OWEFU|nr:unnamed protein product [Owenia fusiformis]
MADICKYFITRLLVVCASVQITCLGLQVIKPPSDKAAIAGSNVHMDCHVNTTNKDQKYFVLWTGYAPRPHVFGEQISANNKIVETMPNGRYKIDPNENFSLIINNVDRNDGGKYRCNDAFTGRPIGQIQPHLVVMDPIKCPPAVLRAGEGEVISFNCTVEFMGNRDQRQIPKFKWRIGNDAVSPTKVEVVGNNSSSSLNITTNVDLNNKQVKCGYELLGIRDHCSTLVRVTFAARKPVLIIKSQIVTGRVMLLNSGAVVTISCKSQANPPAEYSWFYQEDIGKKTLKFVSHKQVLTLGELEPHHSGVYICKASNDLNEKNMPAKASLILQIQDTSPDSGVQSGLQGNVQTGVLAGGLTILILLIIVLIVFIVYVLRRIKRTRPTRGRDARDAEAETPLSEGYTDILNAEQIRLHTDAKVAMNTPGNTDTINSCRSCGGSPRHAALKGPVLYADLDLQNTNTGNRTITLPIKDSETIPKAVQAQRPCEA